jgi:hypothetical protein
MSEPTGTSGPAVSTWDLLRSLGFAVNPTLVSDVVPGLSFDFGNFKLDAICGANRHFVRLILLSGVMVTERSIREVECEMPPEVESAEQGMAWVAWCLDNGDTRRRFEPKIAPAWLAEGRKNFHLLPWNRRMTAYNARPHCFVQRDWARVTLKALGEQLKTVDDEAPVTFGFDGNVLTISCAGKVSPMPAEGSAWTQPYSIRAGALRSLPKRLMSYTIEFSVWESVLTIGNRAYKPSVGIVVGAPARQVPSRLSATEVLSRVQALRGANAQWDAIWLQLNPTADPEVQQLLTEIRGPNMFVPHLGLGVIEDGCKRALALSPEADSLTALREAARRQDRFVRQ